ncbi:MAG: hypothetical protein LBB82_08620 [Treponema sp.]|nr:hypothetical protein [Treponema sp.]
MVLVFAGCAQTPTAGNLTAPRKTQLYVLDALVENAGVNLVVNGVELAWFDGGKSWSSSIPLNDWMVSGVNEYEIAVFWPEAVKFVPGISSVRFTLRLNGEVKEEITWAPEAGNETEQSWSHNIAGTFRAEGFPRLMLEKAERVISSTGALSQEDQQAISDLAGELRAAFTNKDLSAAGELFKYKYADLSAARFVSEPSIRTGTDAIYEDIMGKDRYAVQPFWGRYNFQSTANDRLVKTMQGRIGFPEPALVLTYREDGRTRRYEIDLYFAKIDGKWVILR